MSYSKRARSGVVAAAVIIGGMLLQVFFRDSIQSASQLSGVVVVELVSTSTVSGRFFSNYGYFRDSIGNTYKFASSEQYLSVAEGDTLDLTVKKNYMKSLLRGTDIYFVTAVDAVKAFEPK